MACESQPSYVLQVNAPGEEAAHGGRLGPSQGPQTMDTSLHFQARALGLSGDLTNVHLSMNTHKRLATSCSP